MAILARRASGRTQLFQAATASNPDCAGLWQITLFCIRLLSRRNRATSQSLRLAPLIAAKRTRSLELCFTLTKDATDPGVLDMNLDYRKQGSYVLLRYVFGVDSGSAALSTAALLAFRSSIPGAALGENPRARHGRPMETGLIYEFFNGRPAAFKAMSTGILLHLHAPCATMAPVALSGWLIRHIQHCKRRFRRSTALRVNVEPLLPPPRNIPFAAFMDVPDPFTATIDEAFRTCHLRTMADPDFLTSGTWLGYHFWHADWDAPRLQRKGIAVDCVIRFRMQAHRTDELRLNILALDQIADGVPLTLRGELDRATGRLTAELEYDDTGFRFDWGCVLTPFGIVGGFRAHSGRQAWRTSGVPLQDRYSLDDNSVVYPTGRIWLWKEAWSK